MGGRRSCIREEQEVMLAAREPAVHALGCAPSVVLRCNSAETLQVVPSLLTDNANVERSVLASPDAMNQLMYRFEVLAIVELTMPNNRTCTMYRQIFR
jgi:hypothetical protein